MNWNQIEAQWKECAGSARAHWSKLTDDDWQAVAGKRQHLVECVQKRYEIAKQEAEKQVDEWSAAVLGTVETSRTH